MKSGRDKLEQCQIISVVIVFAGLVIMMFGSANDSIVMMWVSLAVVIGAVVYMVINFRCPHCSSLLYPKAGIPDYCPHCGKRID